MEIIPKIFHFSLSRVFLLIILLSFFVLPIFAQRDVNPLNPDSIREFTREFLFRGAFDSRYWEQNWLNIIIYFFAPFLFLWLLLYAIFSELNIFTPPIRNALAILIAIIALPIGVMQGTISLLANLGGFLATAVFFAVVFLLGLSAFYRRKAREFGFFMGSRFLTILIIHSPLILIFAILGMWLGTTRLFDKYVFSLFSGNIARFGNIIVPIGTLIIFGLIIFLTFLYDFQLRGTRKWRNALVGLIFAIVLSVFFIFFSDELSRSMYFGAVFGALLGTGFAILEWGRRYALRIDEVMSEASAIEQRLTKQIEELGKKIETINTELAKPNLDAATRESLMIELNKLMDLRRYLQNQLQEILTKAEAEAARQAAQAASG
jgi:hypothetical protein